MRFIPIATGSVLLRVVPTWAATTYNRWKTKVFSGAEISKALPVAIEALPVAKEALPVAEEALPVRECALGVPPVVGQYDARCACERRS